jgi:hypothetical protein
VTTTITLPKTKVHYGMFSEAGNAMVAELLETVEIVMQQCVKVMEKEYGEVHDTAVRDAVAGELEEIVRRVF